MALGKLAEVRTKAITRLGKIESLKLQPTEEAQDAAVRSALDEYSSHRPRELVKRVAGDGQTRRWVLKTLLSAEPVWLPRTSRVQALEILEDPDTDDEHRRELEAEEWEVRIDAAGDEVLWLLRPPGTSETLSITWTRPQQIETLDGTDATPGTTVPDGDVEGFLLLVLANLAGWVARSASDLKNESMGLDQVDYDTIDRRWRDNEKSLRKQALERFVPTEFAPASGTSVDYRSRDRYGFPRVSH